MPEYPGLPRLTKNIWKVTAALGIGAVVSQGVGISPLLVGLVYFIPEAATYAVFAFIGWIVLYITDIMAVVREHGWQFLQEFTNSLTLRGFVFVFFFIVVYLNTVVGIAAILGFTLGSTVGLPLVGLVVALLYPSLDFRLSIQYISPGFLMLAAVLFVLHAIGILREVTANAVIQGMHRHRPPRSLN